MNKPPRSSRDRMDKLFKSGFGSASGITCSFGGAVSAFSGSLSFSLALASASSFKRLESRHSSASNCAEAASARGRSCSSRACMPTAN